MKQADHRDATEEEIVRADSYKSWRSRKCKQMRARINGPAYHTDSHLYVDTMPCTNDMKLPSPVQSKQF